MEEEFRYCSTSKNYLVTSYGRVFSLRYDKFLSLTQGKSKYKYVTIDGKKEYVHRLVGQSFLFLTKDKYIDHIDGDRENNNVSNLRVCTNRENGSFDNRKISKTSQYTGVYFNIPANKYRAQIRLDGKRVYLGFFTSEFDAHIAYQNALKQIL